MKKLQFLLVFIFTATGLYAQTKEETLKWLSNKINAYNNNETLICQLENITNYWTHKTTFDTSGSGIIYYTCIYSSGTISHPMTFTGYLSDLTNVTIDQDNRGCDEQRTYISLLFKPNTVFWKDNDGKIGKADGLSVDLKWSLEDDLLNRMVKAFRHLIDLQKPKEIF